MKNYVKLFESFDRQEANEAQGQFTRGQKEAVERIEHSIGPIYGVHAVYHREPIMVGISTDEQAADDMAQRVYDEVASRVKEASGRALRSRRTFHTAFWDIREGYTDPDKALAFFIIDIESCIEGQEGLTVDGVLRTLRDRGTVELYDDAFIDTMARGVLSAMQG